MINLRFPTSVDINVTARCNLDCSFCWGPDHKVPDLMSTADWIAALDFLAKHGTKAVVVTGGEPLTREDLDVILAHAKAIGLRVTLSTNCLLLKKVHDKVLPFVDDIGIPIDGSTPEANQKMRLGNPRAFGAAIAALPLIQAAYPNIEVTIRTVVSRVNVHDINSLGTLLASRTELFNRWKLYQFAPFSIGSMHADIHGISNEEFDFAVSSLSDLSGLRGRIDSQTAADSMGRYVFVGPTGDVYGVEKVGGYQLAGSFKSMTPDELLLSIQKVFDAKRNNAHAIIAKG